MPKYSVVSATMLFLCLAWTSLHAQKDTLVSTTDHVIMGEVKGMNKGVLKIETEYSDSDFAIEWAKVKKLNTTTEFLISTTEGARYNGILKTIAANEVINPEQGS